MKRPLLALLIILGLGIALFIVAQIGNPTHKGPSSVVSEHVQAEETDRKQTVTIEDGDTFSIVSESIGIQPGTMNDIVASTEKVYDLTRIRVGKVIDFYFDHETDELNKIVYEPNTEEILTITSDDDGWSASLDPIQYEIRRKRIEGTIENSLYEAALEAGFDERAIIDLAEIFAWQIDFAVDIRTGDSFAMEYEERYRDGKYIMPGQILAAKFNNNGVQYEGFYYEENDENDGYFDRKGQSLQKVFLKSPLQYRYISSGFGIRIDPISHTASKHTGIDYAAPYGTPAVTVGDGTVIRAGWYGGYGNSVDVRHNETYTTRYGHFSRLAVKAGQKVQQGDIVGYVGSTGYSTGPHLHYEMITFGSQVDPFSIDIPAGKALDEGSMNAFTQYISQFSL